LDIKIPDYYACGECGKVFANDIELSEHKALVHDDKYVLLPALRAPLTLTLWPANPVRVIIN
jgi:hypothetical protein